MATGAVHLRATMPFGVHVSPQSITHLTFRYISRQAAHPDVAGSLDHAEDNFIGRYRQSHATWIANGRERCR